MQPNQIFEKENVSPGSALILLVKETLLLRKDVTEESE
jgi:hypothetical protein